MEARKVVFLTAEERAKAKEAAAALETEAEARRKQEIQRKLQALQSRAADKPRSRSPRTERKEQTKPAVKDTAPRPRVVDKYRKANNPDWEPTEDTWRPLEVQIQPKLMFGKGTFGGVAPQGELKDTRPSFLTKPIEQMTTRDWRIFREDRNIIVKGGKVPEPIRSWEESDIPFNLVQTVKGLGYKEPTAIQMQAIPCGLEAKDLLALAPTGSGKSAAFLIPILANLQMLPELEGETARNGPYGLILSPTRELALQIHAEATKLAESTRIRSLALVGGHDVSLQSIELNRGVELLIGTPGRIKDCLDRQYLVLNQCYFIVIDEADKIILLEQDEELRAIMGRLPGELMKSKDPAEAEMQERYMKTGEKMVRVTQLFSATMDAQIERIWREWLSCPAYISIGEPGTGSSNIAQSVVLTTDSDKKWRLRKAIKQTRAPVLIFVNQKTTADTVVGYLQQFHMRVMALHGGKSQQSREQVMDSFRSGSVDVLVTTDLMSRGIDVDGIRHVINFDAPHSITDYEHRIGRTGRAGATGLATTFLTPADEAIFADLKSFLLKNKQEVPEDLSVHPATKKKEEEQIAE